MHKQMKQLLMTLGIILLSAASALAVDLENKDGQTYQVKITENGTTREVSIETGAKLSNICSNCQIDINGIGSINAQGTDVVTIENGKLTLPVQGI
ncbi:MAG TPA: hypothetical protein DCE56_11645 [Cyanobacteria bacterium UBA8553]|nr:hypothetical protein [Cyanobacteria bacterium UBA8553]